MSDTEQNVAAHGEHDEHGEHGGEHHAMPMKILVGVFAILLVLTWLTVAATWVDLGKLNIWVALLIAVVKAGFVAMYFMHLRYDAPFNGVILITSLLFVALFIAITLTDTTAYQPAVEAATGSP